VEEVKAAANYITGSSGGRGAVREVVDLILSLKTPT
jgi:3-deoxy-D-manno-octulosonate 8-phosphate phosphatase KdsC-like HAD superfamily phosphatase